LKLVQSSYEYQHVKNPNVLEVEYRYPIEMSREAKKECSSKPLEIAITIVASAFALILIAVGLAGLALTAQNPFIIQLVLAAFVFLFAWIIASRRGKNTGMRASPTKQARMFGNSTSRVID